MFTFTTEERIVKAKINLQVSNPFFSYILMHMRIQEVKEDNMLIPSMGVNKIGDLFYAKKFVNGLSNEHLTSVLCHEVLHIALMTFDRERKRDLILWNIATDYAINWILKKDGFQLPKDLLLANDNGEISFSGKGGKTITINIKDLCAEEIYDKLLEHAETIKSALSDGKGGFKGQFDKHLSGDQDADGKSQGKLKSEADRLSNNSYWKDKTVEGATMAKARGKSSSCLDREIDSLLNPKIDWRKRLFQFITKDLIVDFTMKKPGRRFYGTGTYMPSVIRENLEILVAVDVSGSIGAEEFQEFMSEVLGIANGFSQIKMRLLFWSTYIDEVDDLEVTRGNTNIIMNHKINNSGGTTFSCVKKYINEKGYTPRVIVCLSDGYWESDPEVYECQHLFVLSKNHTDEIAKKYGDVCKLSDIER